MEQGLKSQSSNSLVNTYLSLPQTTLVLTFLVAVWVPLMHKWKDAVDNSQISLLYLSV